MSNVYVYAISFAAAFVVVCLWRLLSGTPLEVYHYLLALFRESFTYRLLYRRPNGSMNMTPLAGVVLLTYISGNIVASAIYVTDKTQLIRRLGNLATVNLVPLYTGGITSVVERNILGLSRNTSCLAHTWIGRIFAVQALLHGLLHMSITTYVLSAIDIAVSGVI